MRRNEIEVDAEELVPSAAAFAVQTPGQRKLPLRTRTLRLPTPLPPSAPPSWTASSPSTTSATPKKSKAGPGASPQPELRAGPQGDLFG